MTGNGLLVKELVFKCCHGLICVLRLASCFDRSLEKYPASENPTLARYLSGGGSDDSVGQRQEGHNRERRSRGYTNQRGRKGEQYSDSRGEAEDIPLQRGRWEGAVRRKWREEKQRLYKSTGPRVGLRRH